MTSSASFNGDRLRLARVFNGFSQSELGERVDVSHASISQAENGVRQPSSVVVDRLSVSLGFDRSFFYLGRPTEFRDEECHFRRRKTTPLGTRNRVLATGTLFNELITLLDASVRLPAYNVPSLPVRTGEDIEAAAEKCRTLWGLGVEAPVKNVARVLERAGVVITRFAASAVKVDAFSRAGVRGVIVLNTDKDSTSRGRFDKAHESGHLVMHHDVDALSEGAEDQANRFASAFLLPRAAFAREFPSFGNGRVGLEKLVALKVRWRTSIAAMVRRAFDLKLLSASQYEAAFKQYYARQWHRGEPEEPPDEPPELVSLSFDVLQQQGVTRDDVARRLGWTLSVMAKVAPDVVADQNFEDGNGDVIPFAQLKSRRPVRP